MALNNSELTEKVLALAIDLSRAWKHHYLGIEHVFAASCRLEGSIGGALGRCGVSLSELEEGILALVPPGDDTPIWDGMPETPRYRRLMKSMVNEEAEACRALRIEPVHIVAAALREGRSVPCRYLLSRNVDLLMLRDDVRGKRQASSANVVQESSAAGAGSSANAAAKKSDGKLKNLLQFGRDLVELSRQGKIDPVIGRADEVRRVLQVLTRKTKSNPVLVGEAGVGKTAVANGLAQRIAAGTVPDMLKNKRVIELSLSSLVAGTGHRGEFEKRLQSIIEELTQDHSVILFIDEIHQIVGAGESRGGMDAGNILKPALARGDFAVMGATTTDEYRRYIEADPALERRFQQVMVGEPSEEDTFEILKGLRGRYEQHHGVHFPDETLLAAVKMSVRFLPDRNLPDKAIDLIDEAAARVKTKASYGPSGADPSSVAGSPASQERQIVGEDVISEVVADWTGIPISRIANEEEARLLDMENLLRGRVVGQDHAVAAVASTIRVVRVGLSSPNRPAGVFLFMGPSGVGKTELAKTLAEFLFGSEREMVRLDMSEFHDKHSVARLIGAPPGYVGYEGEGQLTKAVRTKPFCVLLLDEVEKAHPDIFDIFLQVFDDGRLTDAKGRTVNFTNAIIIMTSNLGARNAYKLQVAASAAAGAVLDDEEEAQEAPAAIPPPPPSDTGFVGQLEDMPEAYQVALRGHFRPEFLNRIDEIVVFRRLQREDLRGIVAINLQKSIKRIRESRQVETVIGQDAIELLLDKGYHPEFGARPLNRAIENCLTRPMAEYLLRHKTPPNTTIVVSRDGDKLVFTPQVSGHMGDTSDHYAVGYSPAPPPPNQPPIGNPPQGGIAPQPNAPGGYQRPGRMAPRNSREAYEPRDPYSRTYDPRYSERNPNPNPNPSPNLNYGQPMPANYQPAPYNEGYSEGYNNGNPGYPANNYEPGYPTEGYPEPAAMPATGQPIEQPVAPHYGSRTSGYGVPSGRPGYANNMGRSVQSFAPPEEARSIPQQPNPMYGQNRTTGGFRNSEAHLAVPAGPGGEMPAQVRTGARPMEPESRAGWHNAYDVDPVATPEVLSASRPVGRPAPEPRYGYPNNSYAQPNAPSYPPASPPPPPPPPNTGGFDAMFGQRPPLREPEGSRGPFSRRLEDNH